MNDSKIKVLVVDDSAYSRQTIRKILEKDDSIEVVSVAVNGVDAMAKTLKLKPDLITLDFEMPEMDGFTFLRWLMKERPTPVIMVSSYSDNKTVFKALELGAVDFIVKPVKSASVELNRIEKDLLNKVRGVTSLRMEKLSKNLQLLQLESEVKSEETSDIVETNMNIVAIGSSTGGPAALQIVLTRLPKDFPAAVLVSQHMPKGFTGPLSERLNRLSEVKIKEAEDNDLIERGRVFICPGGMHMTIKEKSKKYYIRLKDADEDDRYIPSVDIMMSSVAENYGNKAAGVILTGMGSDGKRGILEIKSKGGYTIAESEETAVVFGMPNEAIKTGFVDDILPIHEISGKLADIAKKE
ncbi:MAG: chemotaxis response regulator protein-glutamate methylesterase [Nitrospiraceae bacterium]|nr:chemotaxis response regulator protein-glutamate methylesterase [Nitrospiraceae bacterium]